MPGRRILGAIPVTRAIFALAALLGRYFIEHLLGRGGDPDHCVVCAAIHDIRAGMSTLGVAPIPVLPLVGLVTLQRQIPTQTVAFSVSPSRAPPSAA